MQHEYKVVYTVDGQGYTKDEPWLDTFTEDEEEARQRYASLLDWFKVSKHEVYEVWTIVRPVGDWQRVDFSPLPC